MLMATSDTIAALEQVSRGRSLTLREALSLERAVIRSGACRRQKFWTAGDIRRLERLLRRGKKPAQIGPIMGRSERAVWRMIYRQGWAVRTYGQCSIALPPQT